MSKGDERSICNDLSYHTKINRSGHENREHLQTRNGINNKTKTETRYTFTPDCQNISRRAVVSCISNLHALDLYAVTKLNNYGQ